MPPSPKINSYDKSEKILPYSFARYYPLNLRTDPKPNSSITCKNQQKQERNKFNFSIRKQLSSINKQMPPTSNYKPSSHRNKNTNSKIVYSPRPSQLNNIKISHSHKLSLILKLKHLIKPGKYQYSSTGFSLKFPAGLIWNQN